MSSEVGVSERLAQIARQLRVAGEDQTSAMQRIAQAAVEAIEGAEYASVTLVSARGLLTTPVAVGDLARQCDSVQQQLGQGPCLDAAAGTVATAAIRCSFDPGMTTSLTSWVYSSRKDPVSR